MKKDKKSKKKKSSKAKFENIDQENINFRDVDFDTFLNYDSNDNESEEEVSKADLWNEMCESERQVTQVFGEITNSKEPVSEHKSDKKNRKSRASKSKVVVDSEGQEMVYEKV